MLFRRSGSELLDTFTNIILLRIFPLENIYLSRPGIIDARARYRAAARRLRNTALKCLGSANRNTWKTQHEQWGNEVAEGWDRDLSGPATYRIQFHALFRHSQRYNALCGTNFCLYIRDLAWYLPLDDFHCTMKQVGKVQLWCSPKNRGAQTNKYTHSNSCSNNEMHKIQMLIARLKQLSIS
jgi:hypothetical protein